MFVKSLIIMESPLADVAGAWELLLEDVSMVEKRLGWRYLWEGPSFLRRIEGAVREAQEAYRRGTLWEPADAEETENRRRLMADLCAYERVFANLADAIRRWPTLKSSERDPQLDEIVARAGAV